eukprot:11222305-Lingulodinium_polyedra.AAC.1
MSFTSAQLNGKTWSATSGCKANRSRWYSAAASGCFMLAPARPFHSRLKPQLRLLPALLRAPPPGRPPR